MNLRDRIFRALSAFRGEEDRQELIVCKIRMDYLLSGDAEVQGETGVQVIWRDGTGPLGYQTFEIFDFDSRFDVAGMSDVQLMKFVQHRDRALDAVIALAEETLDTVTIAGRRVEWADLDAQGYEFASINRWHNPVKPVALPRR